MQTDRIILGKTSYQAVICCSIRTILRNRRYQRSVQASQMSQETSLFWPIMKLFRTMNTQSLVRSQWLGQSRRVSTLQRTWCTNFPSRDSCFWIHSPWLRRLSALFHWLDRNTDSLNMTKIFNGGKSIFQALWKQMPLCFSARHQIGLVRNSWWGQPITILEAVRGQRLTGALECWWAPS